MKLINDRYFLLNKLGQGGSGVTYKALDRESDRQVAIKVLSLTGLDNWKKIELFEREAKILKQLNHPAIPQYIDYFQIETEKEIEFYLVRELAPDRSFADLIARGWLPEEKTVKDIAEKVLEILVYLQQLTPPVIHRDLKPQNIIYQPDTGKLFLVDFGAVRDTYHHTVMGSTVVGTYGYMAPEQFRGGAVLVLSTDLYGLGCTLLFLLMGNSPAELPQKKLKTDFRKAVKIDRSFADWIDKLIEPDTRQRFLTAQDALLVLQSKKDLQDYQYELAVKPRYSSVKLQHAATSPEDWKLTIEIPPSYKRKQVDRKFYLWLGWGILSLVNRTAILVTALWIGKIYILLWFANIFLVGKKFALLRIIEYFFLTLFVCAIAMKYITSIPAYSMMLVFIDLLIELNLKHNLIQHLLLSTRIELRNNDRLNATTTKGLFGLKHQKYSKLQSSKMLLAELFLTKPERAWLREELDDYDSFIKKDF